MKENDHAPNEVVSRTWLSVIGGERNMKNLKCGFSPRFEASISGIKVKRCRSFRLNSAHCLTGVAALLVEETYQNSRRDALSLKRKWLKVKASAACISGTCAERTAQCKMPVCLLCSPRFVNWYRFLFTLFGHGCSIRAGNKYRIIDDSKQIRIRHPSVQAAYNCRRKTDKTTSLMTEYPNREQTQLPAQHVNHISASQSSKWSIPLSSHGMCVLKDATSKR